MTTNLLIADEDLMLKYQAGDIEAFNQLYHRHNAALYRYFLRQCHQPTIAEELYQETWIKIIKASPHYVITAKFTTYLYRIAHNQLCDYYRHSSTKLANVCEPNDDIFFNLAYDPEQKTLHRQQLILLNQLVQQLPTAQKEVFLLSQDTGLNLHDIAHIVGIKYETAKSRLRYALRQLRQGLQGLNDE